MASNCSSLFPIRSTSNISGRSSISFLISRMILRRSLSCAISDEIETIIDGSSDNDTSLTIGSLASSGNLDLASLTASLTLSKDFDIVSAASNSTTAAA